MPNLVVYGIFSGQLLLPEACGATKATPSARRFVRRNVAAIWGTGNGPLSEQTSAGGAICLGEFGSAGAPGPGKLPSAPAASPGDTTTLPGPLRVKQRFMNISWAPA